MLLPAQPSSELTATSPTTVLVSFVPTSASLEGILVVSCGEINCIGMRACQASLRVYNPGG